jgi:hypothetical protein
VVLVVLQLVLLRVLLVRDRYQDLGVCLVL